MHCCGSGNPNSSQTPLPQHPSFFLTLPKSAPRKGSSIFQSRLPTDSIYIVSLTSKTDMKASSSGTFKYESLGSWRDRESLPDITVLLCRSLCPLIHIPSQETHPLILLFKAHCPTSPVFSRHPSFSLAIFEITFQDVC